MPHARPSPVTVDRVVKKALVVMLVVIVVVTGLPLIMGLSGMAPCPDCGSGLLVGGGVCTLAFLVAGAALLLVLLAHHVRGLDVVLRLRLHAFLLERPPRLA